MLLETGTLSVADRRMILHDQASVPKTKWGGSQDHLDQYRLHLAASGLSRSTIRSYIFDVQQLLKWCEDTDVDHWNLTTKIADEYVRHLKETTHQLRPRHVGRYSATTIARKLHAIIRFCDFLIDENVVPRNPFRDISTPILVPRPTGSNIEIFSVETIRKLIATCDTTVPKGIRDRAILFCIAGFGLRVEEVHKLKITDLDLQEGFLKVPGRNNRRRTMPIIGDIEVALRAWVMVRLLHVNNSKALFTSLHHSKGRGEPGKRLSKRAIRAIVDTRLEMIGSKKTGMSCDALRRSAIAHSLAKGADLDGVRSMFGISPKSLHAYEEYLIEIGKGLDKKGR